MLSHFRLRRRVAGKQLTVAILAVLLAAFRLFLVGDTAQSSAVTGQATYLPVVVSGSLSQVDLAITALEVTQSIQTSQNTVPLVAHRPSVVRVYARMVGGDAPGAIAVSLTARRGGVLLGKVFSGPQTVPQAPSRGDYASTFNITLPPGWLWGKVELTASVDAAGVIAEVNEDNNTAVMLLDFYTVPPLQIKIVPINYMHEGTPGTGLYPGQQLDPVSDWLMRAFPVSAVDVTYHPGYHFSGDLSNSHDWVRLLLEITALKASESAPASQVYYALVPTRNGPNRWFHAGIAGMGWLGTRVSVGLDLGQSDRTGALAGHEIGHNFGRSHAPCGLPSGVDAGYPHDGASIGEYGLDVANKTLFSPTQAVDMMSYCSPKWISDYTYLALYEDQRANGLPAAGRSVPSLLVQAHFDAAGVPRLLPVYSLPQLPSPPAAGSDYAIELLDAAGRVIASQPVPLLTAAEPGVTAQMIQASVPLPAEPVARIRLLQAGVPLGERDLVTPVARLRPIPASLTRTAATLTLRWDSPQTPALVRYTPDDGQSWTTLAINLRGGRLTLNPANLPGPAGRFQIIPADTAGAVSVTVEWAP